MPVFFIVSPLLLMIIINTFELPQIETSLITIPKLPNYRNKDITFTNMWENLCITIKCILTKDWLPYNAFDKYFTMYRLSIIFTVIGSIRLFVDMLKNIIKNYSQHIVFLILLMVNLFLGMLLGGDGPNINRLNGIFFALFYCLLYGMKYSYALLKDKLSENVGKDNLVGLFSQFKYVEKKVAMGIILVYCFYFFTFANYYFNSYSKDIIPQEFFADTYRDITEFIETDTGEPKVVYTNISYIYYFFSDKVDPFQANIRKEGTRTYWKYVFHLPSDIETGAIYIINNTDDGTQYYIEKLEEMGFELFESGMLKCYYKT